MKIWDPTLIRGNTVWLKKLDKYSHVKRQEMNFSKILLGFLKKLQISKLRVFQNLFKFIYVISR